MAERATCTVAARVPESAVDTGFDALTTGDPLGSAAIRVCARIAVPDAVLVTRLTAVGVTVDGFRLSVKTRPKASATANAPIAASATSISPPTSRRGIGQRLRRECVLQRQDQFEGASRAGDAFQPDAPTMNFGQRARNR